MRHFILDVPVAELIQKYSSPLYVYDEGVLRRQFQRLKNAIPYPQTRLFYACKANGNLHLLKILREEGACLDAVSPWEVELAYKAGFTSNQILYTGDNITAPEMEYCIRNTVPMNLGSLCQIERYGRLCPGGTLCVRINPDCGAGHHSHTITGGPASKFGIYMTQLDQIHTLAQKYRLTIIGVHAHIGSGILHSHELLAATDIILSLASRFQSLQFINIGGGLGVPYRPNEEAFDVEAFGEALAEKLEKFSVQYGSSLRLYLEPGRFVVAQCGVLLVSVVDVKETPLYRFVGTDSGFNHLLRPPLYGSYHNILNCSSPYAPLESYIVTGNICESGDVFTQNKHGFEARSLPKVQEGDVLAICDVGAYGYAMSSQYNMRPRPAEILISQNTHTLIRRRESFHDLFGLMEV